jgi:dUTP pyrophosphatase
MIATGAGVIDADYRGVVFVLLFNHSDKDFTGTASFFANHWGCAAAHGLICSFGGCLVVNEGDRIAQLILEKVETPPVLEVEVRNSLLMSFNAADLLLI